MTTWEWTVLGQGRILE